MTSILLIRHAETALNASRVIQFPDTPLSTRGQWQAERLAARLSRSGVAHILSSDYRRAQETAQQICQTTKASLMLEPQLRERHLGELRGMAYADVRDKVFADDFVPEAGETWAAFERRVDRLWDHIQRVGAAVDGELAVVTHGLVCRSIVGRHLTLHTSPDPLRFPNASVTTVDPEHPWSIREFASDSHLH